MPVSDKSRSRKLGYLFTLLCCVAFLFIGNRLAVKAGAVLPGLTDPSHIKGKVVSISSRTVTTEEGFSADQTVTTVTLRFFVRVDSGEYAGQQLLAEQISDDYVSAPQPEVEVGDRVIITVHPDPNAEVPYLFGDYSRSGGVFVLCTIFFLLLLFFGRMKGFHTIVALIFTCAAVLGVFLPTVLAGANIYFSALGVCIFIVLSTLLLVNGATLKTMVAAAGCGAGILVAAGLTALMSHLLKLTGLVTQDSLFLASIGNIDLVAIVFAAIVIGAVGAVMDVAVSISSALWELHEKAPSLTSSQLFASGITIGRDMMSTMANTLVLAYIGSSLSTVLLLVSYTVSIDGLLNIEMIVTELLQAIIGSTAVLLTIPLTSLLAGLLYAEPSKPPVSLPEDF